MANVRDYFRAKSGSNLFTRFVNLHIFINIHKFDLVLLDFSYFSEFLEVFLLFVTLSKKQCNTAQSTLPVWGLGKVQKLTLWGICNEFASYYSFKYIFGLNNSTEFLLGKYHSKQ